MSDAPDEWAKDCLKWRGRRLVGQYKHYCFEWDELPVDETCPEWPCGCFWVDAPPAAMKDGGTDLPEAQREHDARRRA